MTDCNPSRLNPRYRFDHFAIGSSNRVAHAAAFAVAKNPSLVYNPLFLHGIGGCGKTHLLQAIGRYSILKRTSMNVRYVSGERFTHELVDSQRRNLMADFRETYRSVNMLLFDDLQFIVGKNGPQKEFIDTFDALYWGSKQIVIASDRPPGTLSFLSESLLCRIEAGHVMEVPPSDLETKLLILKMKSHLQEVVLPDEVAHFIANRVRSNIRELEGALIRLIAWCAIKGVEISTANAELCLGHFFRESGERRVRIEDVQRAVSYHFGITILDLKRKSNSPQSAGPRQIAMYLSKRLTGASLPEIGRCFGSKHHSTVMYSVSKIEDQRASDKNLNEIINQLLETLN